MTEAGPRMYRFLQSIYHSPGNCLIVTARSRESLGYLRRLLWDPREAIDLQPLKRAEAAGLFNSAVAAYKLDSLDLDGFRSRVLRSARQSRTDSGHVPPGGAARIPAGTARQVFAAAHGRAAGVYRMR